MGIVMESEQGGRGFEDDYRLANILGNGTNGTVKEAIHRKTGAKMACKILPCGSAEKEIKIWSELSGHPQILTLRSVYHDFNNGYMISDLCKGRSLYEYINKDYGRLSETNVAKIMKSLVEALQHCHGKGIIHRDVKIDNILLPSPLAFGDIKLTDFGWSTHFSEGKLLFGIAGSLPYMAPEIIEVVGYSKEVDIWSAGVVLYVLLGDRFPYKGEDLAGTLRSIQTSDPNLQTGEWRQVSEPCKDLIKGMLNKDVNKRLTASEILDHPWIKHHTKE